MSLQSNLNSIKDSLNTEEKMLGRFFRLEGFFKKYKNKLIFAISIAIIAYIGFEIKAYMDKQNMIAVNKLHNEIINSNPTQEQLSTLKQKAPDLYALYMLKKASEQKDIKALKSISANDKIISSMLNYQIATISKEIKKYQRTEDNNQLDSLANFQEIYLLIKDKRYEEAKRLINSIGLDSELKTEVDYLRHILSTK